QVDGQPVAGPEAAPEQRGRERVALPVDVGDAQRRVEVVDQRAVGGPVRGRLPHGQSAVVLVLDVGVLAVVVLGKPDPLRVRAHFIATGFTGAPVPPTIFSGAAT